MTRIVTICLIIAAFALTTAPASASEYIDVDQSTGAGGAASIFDWQQTFIPSADNITAISINLAFLTGNVTVQLLDDVCGDFINHGSGSGTGWVKCDLVGHSELTPGVPYVIKVLSDTQFGIASGDPYADGLMYMDCAPYVDGSRDLMFKTWAETDPTGAGDETWGAIKSAYR